LDNQTYEYKGTLAAVGCYLGVSQFTQGKTYLVKPESWNHTNTKALFTPMMNARQIQTIAMPHSEKLWYDHSIDELTEIFRRICDQC
jgi:hypothetical protein